METARTQLQGSQSTVFTVPDAKHAPDTGKPPSHHPRVPNYADNDELARTVWARHVAQFQRFSTSGERKQMESRMMDADRMWRASQRKPEGKGDMKTHFNVSDTGYHRRIRTITAGECSIMFPDDELPAKFEPPKRANDVEPDIRRQATDQMNAIEAAVFEEDNRVAKIKHLDFLLNKYGNLAVQYRWDRKVRDRKVRTVKAAVNGKSRVTWKTVKTTEKDCPTFDIHDMRHVFFDCTVDSEDQTDWLIRVPTTLADIYSAGKNGEYMNLDKITTAALYRGENEAQFRTDQQANAGATATDGQEDGRFELWDDWMTLPIDDKGKWSPETTPPTLHYCTFLGRSDSTNAVALRISPNPYNHGELPIQMLHCLDDDKGLVHAGFADIGTDLYWQATTLINMCMENVALRNRAPLLKTGIINTRNFVWSQNKVLEGQVGADLKPLTVPDTTNVTQFLYERTEDLGNKTFGTDKPIMGEVFGGRTSATEAKNAFDAATRPALEKLAYLTEQLFPKMFRMDRENIAQYGDPDRLAQLVGGTLIPETLFLQFGVKVTTILQFESNTLARQQMGAFLAQNYQQAREAMTPEGVKLTWQHAWRMMKFPDGAIIFGTSDIQDAMQVAREETLQMLRDGVVIDAQPNQNHEVHIREKSMALDEIKLVLKAGEELVPLANVVTLERNIQQHRLMEEDRRAAAARPVTPTAGMLQQGQTPGMPMPMGGPMQAMEGNVTGNTIEAQEGALANA